MAKVSVRRFGNWSQTRGGIFLFELLYLIALWLLAILYFTHTIHPRHTIGNMPTAVPWFGALGAVLISMTGIFEHRLDWNPGYALWHWARPLVGGSVAVIGILILQAGIVSVGADRTSRAARWRSTTSSVSSSATARTFRDLVKRVVDVILRPGDSGPAARAPTIGAITPNTGPAGTQATIAGSGFTKVQAVIFGQTPAQAVSTVSATRITATAPPGPAAGSTVAVTVSTSAGSASDDFPY